MSYAELLLKLERKVNAIERLKSENAKLVAEINNLKEDLKFMHEWVQGKIEHAYQTQWSDEFQEWVEKNKTTVAELIVKMVHQLVRPVTYDEIEVEYERRYGKVARDTIKRVARALSQKKDKDAPFVRVKYKGKVCLTPRIWEVKEHG